MLQKATPFTTPLTVPADRISLPTGGAVIEHCTFLAAGEKDPGPVGQMIGLNIPVDMYKVEGRIHPVDPAAPDICFELGMPLSWNGKIIQQGGGGLNGFVPPSTMPLPGQDFANNALSQGYVVFGSDSGHTAAGGNMWDCEWALNQESFENFAHLSLKKMRDTAVYLTEMMYGRTPEKTYFYGGSNGGRECIKAITNYPADYDGAICFYPVLYWILKVLADVRNANILESLGESAMIDEQSYAQIVRAAMDICDAADGVTDGLISNLTETAALLPQIKQAVKALVTPEQYKMLESLNMPMHLPYDLAYGDVTLPGYQSFEGVSLYSQFGSSAVSRDAGQVAGGDSALKYIIAQDADFDPHQFDALRLKDRILEISRWMDAYGTDFDAFYRKGGKLILVQGTSDPLVTVHGTTQFYENLLQRYGQSTLNEFLKFYVVPGYAHGFGGDFTVSTDFIGALDNWVEHDIAPENMTVTDISPMTAGRTRPLCEYPSYPHYKGEGDINRAENFIRKMP